MPASRLRPSIAALLRAARAVVAALALLELLWEVWLAPLRPGGSWLALKAVPLAVLWPALAGGKSRARHVVSLALLFYFTEGIVRANSEHGRSAWIAAVAAGLAAVAFALLFLAAREQYKAASADRPP